MQVVLRKKIGKKNISLYLDHYNNGARTYEFLKLYLHKENEAEKLTKEQKLENQNVLTLAESIRAQRYFEFQNNRLGFINFKKLQSSFIRYFEKIVERKFDNIKDSSSWKGALFQLRKFVKTDVLFESIDKEWLESFKYFLIKNAKSKNGKPLAHNTTSSYFGKVRQVLKEAYVEGFMHKNPAVIVRGISLHETERGFLNYDELKKLAKTDCEEPLLKNAFLFSTLTGLRWSDIAKLTWAVIQYSSELGNFIHFTQQKTKKTETLPINEMALYLLGVKDNSGKRIFENLKYSAYMNVKLQRWLLKAGITRKITFHSARHTYATLQLTFGSDIYTLSKMLGHRYLKSTEVYARIVDFKKVEAANRISLL